MTIKEKLEKRLNTLTARRDEVTESMVSEDDKEVRAALGETLKALRDDINEVEEMLAEIDEPAEDNTDNNTDVTAEEGRNMNLNVVATMESRTAMNMENLEERNSFKNYMATGKMEKRDGVSTSAVAAVIPENLVNQILEKYEQIGTIYNLVTKTSYPVGQTIPVDGVKPTATWVAEGAGSTAQGKTMGASITFTHHKLRCEIRYTEEVANMTLAAFEAMFVRQVGEAMVKAIEHAILFGDGNGKPTGILTGEIPTGHEIDVNTLDYAALVKCEAALPVEYEAGAVWCMTKAQFMNFIGMVDNNKQPIARVNYGIDGRPERTLLGREVVLFAGMIDSPYDAIIFDFSDYVLNENYNLGIQHARDWDNEDHKTKAVLACDGKVIDKGSLVTLATGVIGG